MRSRHHGPIRVVSLVLAGALVTSACSNGTDRSAPPNTARPARGLAAQVASYELVAGRTGRFIVGLLAADQSRVVSFGTVQLSFSYLGTKAATKPTGGATSPITATFLPIPGQTIPDTERAPRFAEGSEGIGVYGAPNVTFDRAGFWRVTTSATIAGKKVQANAAFEVLAQSAIPAVGDRAPRTDNRIAGATDVSPRSIDSRSAADAPIPDPELHDTSIAAALDAGRPLMVVISTPTYCMSRFCGPITDSVSALAKRFGDRMSFVHLEVWRDYEKGEMNKAAAEWIYPTGLGDAREPWVFVVGRDGKIVERLDNVASDPELEQAVATVLE